MAYDYTITEEYINSLPDEQKNKLIFIPYGETVKMSAMQDLLFIEFLYNLYVNKSVHIEAIMAKIEKTGINPPASIRNNPIRLIGYKKKQTEKIKKSIEDAFKLIETFVKKYDSDLTDVFNYASNINDNTIKKINKNIFGIDDSSKVLDTIETQNKLIKGSYDDYKVTFRETSKPDSTIIKNLKLFTKYKNESIINICSVNEAESFKINNETQLAKLYPELYN